MNEMFVKNRISRISASGSWIASCLTFIYWNPTLAQPWKVQPCDISKVVGIKLSANDHSFLQRYIDADLAFPNCILVVSNQFNLYFNLTHVRLPKQHVQLLNWPRLLAQNLARICAGLLGQARCLQSPILSFPSRFPSSGD